MPTTLLDHAAFGGRWEAMELLLERGANPGPRAAGHLNDLAVEGQLALISLLLDAGVDASLVGHGEWVLHDEAAELLLAHGADVNQAPTPWDHWIWQTCTGNNSGRDRPDYLAALLQRGADVHARRSGKTALHYAAKAGFLESMRVLLEHSADVDAGDEDGSTPLAYVLRAGKRADVAAAAQLLLQAGADPDRANRLGHSARSLAQAARREDLRALGALFDR